MPPLLNVNPVPAFATNVHVPVIAPEVTEHVARVASPGFDSVTEVSVDANPDPVTVTATPVGPDEGLSVRLGTVPVNVAVPRSLAVFPVAATAFDVPPVVNVKPLPEVGVNVHVPPPEPAGETVIVQSVTEVGPLNVIEVSVDANPDQVAVTVTPVGPYEGFSVRLVTVAVNVAVAVSLAGDPTAVTVLEVPPLPNVKPLPVLGVNVHVPPPEPAGETVMVHSRTKVGPSTAMEVSVDANPDAVAVTVTPVGPDDGLSVRLATVPVNVAIAASLAEFPVAVTTVALPPLLKANPVPELATNVHVPVIAPELAAHVARLASPGSDTNTELSVDANPVPVTVTVTPVGPDDGLSVRLATVPVNVAVAVSLAMSPVAITAVALPPLLKANPVPELATNVHVPVIAPELAAHVARLASPGSDSVTESSVDANPVPVTVTVTPVGPDDGLRIRLVTVPVNVAVAVSLAMSPVAITTVALPPLLNANPAAELATNVHVPVMEPEPTAHVATLAFPGSDSRYRVVRWVEPRARYRHRNVGWARQGAQR